MEITRKIVKQPFAPDTTDVLWLDSSGNSDVLKSFCNGQWKETSTPQQDYKVIAPTPGRDLSTDATALGELKKAMLNGTIFDCLLKDSTPAENDLGRVLGYHSSASSIAFYSTGDFEIKEIQLPYSVVQYQGLSAVQTEIDRLDAVGQEFPAFKALNGLLEETSAGYSVCNPEGYQYKITRVNGKIATIEVSTTKVDDEFIAISIEDAQKLIGVTCGDALG